MTLKVHDSVTAQWGDIVNKPRLDLEVGNTLQEAKSYTDDAIANLPAPTNTVESVNGKTGVVVINKTDVGLSNVDNTSDANKPISDATQLALNDKVNMSLLGVPQGVAVLDVDGKVLDGSGNVVDGSSLEWESF